MRIEQNNRRGRTRARAQSYSLRFHKFRITYGKRENLRVRHDRYISRENGVGTRERGVYRRNIISQRSKNRGQ